MTRETSLLPWSDNIINIKLWNNLNITKVLEDLVSDNNKKQGVLQCKSSTISCTNSFLTLS